MRLTEVQSDKLGARAISLLPQTRCVTAPTPKDSGFYKTTAFDALGMRTGRTVLPLPMSDIAYTKLNRA